MSRSAPLQFITLTSSNQLKINEEAVKKLEAIKGPITLVSIAGLYRTGKSYLLNRFLGRQDGFAVGPTTNPCTKGIYIWGEPIQHKGASVILVDTEGIGSTDQDQSYDVKIFSLALLLSSFFIYNSMGVIDERALEGLSLVVHLTEHISTKSGAPLSDFMPNFMWVLRDFVLKLVNKEGKAIDSNQYMEEALLEKGGSSPIAKSKDEIRRSIKEFFRKRDCRCLVRPVNNEEQLQSIDKVSSKELRPEFTKGVSELVQYVMDVAQPKKVMGKNISGSAFVILVRQYIDAMNKGASPDILGSWQFVADDCNRKAAAKAMEFYNSSLSSLLVKIPLKEEELEESNKINRQKAFQIFESECMGDKAKTGPFHQEMEATMEKMLKQAQQQNLKASSEMCNALLEKLYQKYIHSPLTNKKFSECQQLIQAWDRLVQEYIPEAFGSSKFENLSLYLQDKKSGSFLAFSHQLNAVHQERLAEKQKELETLKHEKHTKELEITKAKSEAKILEQEVTRNKQDLTNLQNELNQSKKEMTTMQTEINVARKKETQLEIKSTQLEEKMKATEKQIEFEKEKATQQTNAIKQQLESEKERAENQLKHERDRAERDLRNQKEKLEQQIKNEKEKSEQLLASTKQQFKTETEKVEQQSKSEKERLEHQLSTLQKQLQQEKDEARKKVTSVDELFRQEQSTVKEVKSQLDQTKEKMNELKLQLQKLHKEHEASQARVNQLNEELSKTNKQKESVQSLVTQEGSKSASLATKCSSLESELKNVKEKFDQTKAQLEADHKKAVDRLKKEKEKLEADLEKEKKRVESTQDEMKKEKDRLSTAVEKQTKREQQEINTWELKYQTLSTKFEELSKQMEAQRKELNSAKSQYDAELSNATLKASFLQKQLDSTTAELAKKPLLSFQEPASVPPTPTKTEVTVEEDEPETPRSSLKRKRDDDDDEDAVKPTPSKRAKSTTQEAPAKKAPPAKKTPVIKRKKTDSAYDKLTILQLRKLILEIDPSAVPQNAAKKGELIEIYEKLAKK